MAPKRGARAAKATATVDYSNLKLSDALCPICRGILIEPVTLACNHGFCLSCFEGTMANSNLVCPLCRLRIGSWLRSARKDNLLVNIKFWDAIKKHFPQLVRNRLEGKDDILPDLPEDLPKIKLSAPGEIGKEYQLEKKKDDEELERLKEEEEKASEALLKKYKEELEHLEAEKEERIRLDEEIARRLAEKISQPIPSTSKRHTAKKVVTLDKFLKSKTLDLSNAQKNQPRANNLNKNNSTQNVKLDYHCNVQLNKYATKEYTSLIRKQTSTVVDQKQLLHSFAANKAIMEKKKQHMQKLSETECVSDSSDCIESECRYFKPIEHKYNPRPTNKPAIRVPCIVPSRNSTTIIRSPTGKNLFQYSCSLSAFVQILSSGLSKCDRKSDSDDVIIIESGSDTSPPKPLTNGKEKQTPNKRRIKKSGNSPRKKLKPSECISKLNGVVKNKVSAESPPFCGFKREDVTAKIYHNYNDVLSGQGVLNSEEHTDDLEAAKKLRRVQEEADLEFARKLHKELNCHNRHSKGSTVSASKKKKKTGRQEL